MENKFETLVTCPGSLESKGCQQLKESPFPGRTKEWSWSVHRKGFGVSESLARLPKCFPQSLSVNTVEDDTLYAKAAT